MNAQLIVDSLLDDPGEEELKDFALKTPMHDTWIIKRLKKLGLKIVHVGSGSVDAVYDGNPPTHGDRKKAWFLHPKNQSHNQLMYTNPTAQWAWQMRHRIANVLGSHNVWVFCNGKPVRGEFESKDHSPNTQDYLFRIMTFK